MAKISHGSPSLAACRLCSHWEFSQCACSIGLLRFSVSHNHTIPPLRSIANPAPSSNLNLPRHAYAFGLINVWVKAIAKFPGLANLITQTPGVSSFAKLASGIPLPRRIPPFAPQTFQQWFRRRRWPRLRNATRVLLWPDTFTNHFHPDIARAAVDVLENAGFEVAVPRQPVCCGRPLYGFGTLDRAKSYLLNTIDVLDADNGPDLPVVVLEPSCASIFREELPNLLTTKARSRTQGSG